MMGLDISKPIRRDLGRKRSKARWLVAAIKGGKKLDDFLIEKSGQKGRRKRRSKR
jgi:hypothetical protein